MKRWRRTTRNLILAVLLAMPVGCGLDVQETLQQAQQALRNLNIDQEQMAELLAIAANSSNLAGSGVSRMQVGTGGTTGQLTGAPGFFFPQGSTDGAEIDTCVQVDANSSLRIEDYTDCTDRDGSIVFELPQSTAPKLAITFNGYTEGTTGEADYRRLDGEMVWSMTEGPAGFQILSKEQMTVEVARTSDGQSRTIRLQNNNLWVYTIDFDAGTLTVNTTSSFTDLDALNTVVLDFQEVTFDPNEETGCPRGPESGRASLNGTDIDENREFASWVTVEVNGCADVNLIDSEGKTRKLDPNEIEDLFKEAVDGFKQLISNIKDAQVVRVVKAEGALPKDCSEDPSLVDDIEVGHLLGTWCTAWPRLDDQGNDIWGENGWLDCWRFCVADGVKYYSRFGGVAGTVNGPDTRYEESNDGTYDLTSDMNWVPTDFAATCREPYAFESGTWDVSPTPVSGYPLGSVPTPVTARTLEMVPEGSDGVTRPDIFEGHSDDGTSTGGNLRIEHWVPDPDTGPWFDHVFFADRVPTRQCTEDDWATVE